MRWWSWVLVGCLGCVGTDASSEGDPVDAQRALDASDAAPPDSAVLDASMADSALTDAQPDARLDEGANDLGAPDDRGAPDDMATPDAAQPVVVECDYPAQPFGPLEVNTWRGDVERVRFTVTGLPDPARVMRARLSFLTHDADHPDAEGWIEINGNPRVPLPADPALDNQDRRFEISAMGQLVAGDNQIEFSAFDGPEGAFYRISDVHLMVTGAGLTCPGAPMEPVVDHPAPAGISAFAALAPDFPRAETLSILAGLRRPFTAVLLDFGPVLDRADRQMFGPGAVGERAPNPAHLDAVREVLDAFIIATPDAAERHVQLYLINGPGVRRPADYPRAYPLGPEALDRRLRDDAAIRAELAGYVAALEATVAPVRDRIGVRLVVGLEDNYTRATADALVALARDAGWSGDVGRNPCGCGYGDTARSGDFHEDHPHSVGAVGALDLEPPDAFSNDGWGWTIPNGGLLVDEAAVVAMARAASQSGLWFHLWYDPLQGYPIPADGPRRLRFDVPPAQLRRWLQMGLAR